MKLEQISLRTGFLLALAGWAAAVWLATGFGLGSQLPGADGDADAVPSLPVLPPLAAERMPSADSYSAIGERPLFAEDRRPKPYLLGGSEPAASAALRLTGVLLTSDFGMATFTTEQNRSLRLRLNGEAVDGWQLVGLAPRQATVIGPSGSQVLELAVFNGHGGEPPTVLRVPMARRRRVRSLCHRRRAHRRCHPHLRLLQPQPRSRSPPAACHQPPPRHLLPTPMAPAKRRCRPSANASRPVAASCSNNSSNNRRRPGRWHQPIE